MQWFIYCTYKQEEFTYENLKLENTNAWTSNPLSAIFSYIVKLKPSWAVGDPVKNNDLLSYVS